MQKRIFLVILGFLLVNPSCNPLLGQDILKRLTVTPSSGEGRTAVFLDYPDKAGIIIQSALTGLSFESNMDGIVNERHQPDQGQYVLVIEPVAQIITINAQGYMQERLRISGISAKDMRYYVVEPEITQSDLISVIFTISPQEADLFLNNEPKQSNQAIQLPPGEYDVAISRDGYKMIQDRITIDENNISFSYTLEQINVIPVRITANVPGARVSLNDREQGVIDNRGGLGFFTYPGSYSVSVTAPGYLGASRNITITEGAENTFDLSLQPNNGDLDLTISPSDADVLINQENYAGAEIITLEPGPYQLEVRKQGFAPFSQTIEIVLGETVQKQVTLQPYQGRLQVSVSPSDASMRLIDNAGEVLSAWTGLTILNNINEGEYTLLSEAPGYATVGVPVSIVRDQLTVESVVMEEVRLAENVAIKPVQFLTNISGARVSLNGTERGITDSGGGLGLFLLPGTYEVVVQAPQFLPYREEIAVRNSGINQFNIKLIRDEGTLQFTLDPADAVVTIGDVSVKGLARKSLSPGQYSLLVERDNYYPHSEVVDVQSAKTIQKEVVLKPHAGSLQLSVSPATSFASLIRVDENGSGTLVKQWQGLNILRDLIIGRYLLRLNAANHDVKEVPLVIAKDELLSKVVELEPTTEVVNVLNPVTGRFWMDRNLGASRVARSFLDSEAYGDLYQWGRASDGHEKRNSATTKRQSSSDQPSHGDFIIGSSDWYSQQNDNLWQGAAGLNNPCPVGYRLPTQAEWEEERATWSSNNSAGAFGSQLKLPVAGHRYYDEGSLGGVGSVGYYWSSSVDGTRARFLFFNSGTAGMRSGFRAYGYSVRCLED